MSLALRARLWHVSAMSSRLALLLSASIAVGLSACSATTAENKSPQPAPASTGETSETGEPPSDEAVPAEAPPAWDDFPGSPLTTAKSKSGGLSLAVFTGPTQPPTRGKLRVKLVVTDASTGAPVDDLTIDVTPMMPSMGHGTPVVPKTTAKGSGAYLVEDVSLFMAGTWELEISISGAKKDEAVATVKVK